MANTNGYTVEGDGVKVYVYIVTLRYPGEWDADASQICGVFASHEKAAAYIEAAPDLEPWQRENDAYEYTVQVESVL